MGKERKDKLRISCETGNGRKYKGFPAAFLETRVEEDSGGVVSYLRGKGLRVSAALSTEGK